MDVPETRYATSHDDAHIAYQVFGDGDVDVLWISPWMSHVEVVWEWPPIAHFYKLIASFARVITFDQRGIGLSDRTKGLPDLRLAWTTSARCSTRPVRRVRSCGGRG